MLGYVLGMQLCIKKQIGCEGDADHDDVYLPQAVVQPVVHVDLHVSHCSDVGLASLRLHTC